MPSPPLDAHRNAPRILKQLGCDSASAAVGWPREVFEVAPSIRQRLKSHGLRATNARLVLLDLLETAEHPVAAAAIANQLEPVCDRPTVYRNLAVLSELGLIQELGRAAGQTWFRATQRTPDYDLLFVCTECACAYPLKAEAPAPVSPEWTSALRDAMLLAKGRCADCRGDAV